MAAAGEMDVEGFWIHFDTDVISDEENPAVDYRLPGGLRASECAQLLHLLLDSLTIAGMTVTIFNPRKDADGTIAARIVNLLGESFT